ncbi:hypothetical protein ACF3MZ_28010 [Paenibacillaceae bacterium WGS1546]|uniref:hypothetical protein n=1 Tax=Cohnella sp. WGS1546 TaxID=3366810 RepID=UPI00372D70AD
MKTTGNTDSFEWKRSDGLLGLYRGSARIGHIRAAESEDVAVEDCITPVEEGIYRWDRKLRFAGPYPRLVKQVSMDFATTSVPEYWMIPAVSYNGNAWGRGLEPKGSSLAGECWTFASHRVAVPGATYSEGGGYAVALFGEPGETSTPGFSCSLRIESDSAVHRLSWPETERPLVYAARDRYEAPYEEEWIVHDDGEVVITGYLVVNPIAIPKFSYAGLLDFAWKRYAHPYKEWHSPERIWQLGIQFAKNSLWVEDRFFRGFAWGLYWDGERWTQKRDAPYEIGWVGQNASLANSLLHDYVRTGDRSSLDKGIAALDCWAEYAPLPNGLFRVRFDHIVGKKSAEEVEANDACNLSTAALQFFEAERLAGQCGVARPKYADIAMQICEFAIGAQQANGQWGKSWNNQGECLDPEGTIGAFLVEPLIHAYKRTGELRYLDSAIRGYTYYIRDFEANGYSTAGALDTYCIDKESSIPLLRSGLLLYEITGEPSYLRWAEMAAWYAATWQWHYSVRFPEGSALNELRYDSFGGTSVSTQHHHLDHYGLAFVSDWHKLGAITGNPQWSRRAEAVWGNATAVISDGSLVVWGKQRPPGGQDEGLCQTRWHTSRGRFFGVSQWLVAWPTAFRLELLRHSAVGSESRKR